MQVVQIVNTLAQADGGPARNSFELNLALNRIPDLHVDLVWVHGEVKDSTLAGVESELPVPGPRRLRFARARGRREIGAVSFVKAIRRADVVIIHGYYIGWIPPVAALCRLSKVPYVITPHGSLTSHQLRASRIKKRIFELLVGVHVRRWCARFVTGSEMEAVELREKFPKSIAAVGGVGTSLERFAPVGRLESDPIRLLSISRIAPKKRIDLMLDALNVLKAQGHPARLIVAGSGDEELTHSLRVRARELNVEHDVHFVGAVHGDAKNRMYADADIFLLPSDDENFGIGLAEALAHGLPSITSDRVAAAQAMSPAAGRVLPAPTGPTIAQAVIELSDVATHSAARTAARNDAELSFSWDFIASRWATQLSDASQTKWMGAGTGRL